LSQNQINCIYRDSKGFVWFGTNGGLNRFDGLCFEVFTEDSSANRSIGNNFINSITEDQKGNLWIGTGNGVSILNSQTYEFRKLDYTSVPTNSCGDIYYVSALAADSDGNIWIGTNSGLFFVDLQSDSIQHILLDETSCSAPLNGITSIVQDQNGNMWISGKNGFIVNYDLKKKRKRIIKIPDNSDQLSNSFTKLFVDRDNDLWVGNLYGLYLLDPVKEEWNLRLNGKIRENDGLKRIGAISQNIDGLIWVASDGGGAYVIDKKTWNVDHVRHQPFYEQKLTSNGLSFVHCDYEGIVWIGTTKKGVNFYKKNINKFRIYKNLPADLNSLSHNDVNALAEDQKGNVWIGTDGGGLNYLDRKTQKNTRIGLNGLPSNTLSSDIIVSLYVDLAEKVWIGTYFGGLNKYDPVIGKFTIYKHNPEDTASISDDRIYGICEDAQSNLWAGTLGSGLSRLDSRTGKFTNFNTRNSSLCFDMITSIYRDKKQVLWISTEFGLASFDEKEQTFKTFQNQGDNKNSISDNNVANCLEDSRGFFWICTKNGLNLLDRGTNTFRHFTMDDGLPSNNLQGIVEDKYRNLWISSRNGISRLEIRNVQDISQFDFEFINYNVTDGLQGKEFNRSSALCTSDGEIFFGGTDGLNAFYPDEIKEDTTVAKIIFCDFRIFNKSVPYGQKYNNRVILKNPIFNTSEIALKYHENSFTIEFLALNYFFPEKNVYAYKLDGFDNDWITSGGKDNSATYTNLSNGTYIFHVKELTANSKGEEILLKIVVLPPFWKSWIAYLCYAMLILLILILLRHLILVRERINMRIEQERVEAQHIHEIDTLKIKFFTNISHEFRTPLTLIMAPVEKLLTDLKGKPEEKYLKLIEQNSKRLLRMVNQLLDFRKMEVQGFNFNPSFGDIVAFLKEVVASFKNLSEQKNIRLLFQTEVKELNTYFDKDKLEKIMFNLLSNAFKFTPGAGQVLVSLSVETEKVNGSESTLSIKVEDTGIGISEDKIEKIFTRFFQVDSTGQVEKGTGIGLSLVSEFVKLHGGEISVRSEIGKGSCFSVVLPVGKSEQLVEMIDPFEEEIRPDPDHFTTEGKPVLPESPSILIAEDNDDLRFYLKDNLSGRYEIYEATNGEEALKIIMKIVPDLIISDIMMPKMNGLELCRRVKSDRAVCHIPLILLTAKSSELQQLEGIELGADDYIIKPFNFQILEAKIANIISLRRNMRQLFKNKLHIEPRDVAVTSLDELFMQKVLELVEKNISSTDYSVEMMKRDLGMSRTLLYKKILALTGKPPLEFLRSLRLKRAAVLLAKSQMNVSEIAFQVGFNDPKYFSKHFKNEFGVLPSKYVKK
jgi:signal transduction histidine kinase/ligand-binding sensor domain-containing protein/DNA-binding response OmpR family regulator